MKLKKKLKILKLRGSYIRSRAKLMEEGENPSNYFFNLEPQTHKSGRNL